MPNDTALVTTVVVALGAAFICGLLAVRLRLAAVVGYLVAGMLVGPFTPGFVADPDVAAQLANIGVALLLFGVGIQFNIRDLLAVKGIALVGGIVGPAFATLLGTSVGVLLGWTVEEAFVLGLCISVTSSVALLRALTERDELGTIHGRVAMGWSIAEDLFAIVLLIALPTVAPALRGEAGETAADAGVRLGLGALFAVGKVTILVGIVMVGGVRAVPWLLGQVARTGSRELFILGVLVVALGVAFGGTALFGVSLALGAFVAGLVVSESDLSHQAAADALPFRDAFSVLFFVSVGMLFDPGFLVSSPGLVVSVLLVVLLGKPLIAPLITLIFGFPMRTVVTIAACLAPIGELSFILASLGRELEVLPVAGYNAVVACAILSITLNPVLFRAVSPIENWLFRRRALARFVGRRSGGLARLPAGAGLAEIEGHAVICGYGRVGGTVGQALNRRGIPFVVIEQDRRLVEDLRRRRFAALYGDAASEILLTRANIARARVLVIAIPDPFATRRIVDYGRRINPRLDIVVRTASLSDKETLEGMGAREAVVGELELGLEMTRHALHRYGVNAVEIQAVLQGVRVSWGRRRRELPERE